MEKLHSRQRLIKIILSLATFLLFSFILFLIYNRIFSTIIHNSDEANVLLEANSMLSGNFLLKGWTLSPDTFWTIDVLINSIAIAIRGFTPTLMHEVPAVIYILIITLSLVLVKRKASITDSWVGLVVCFAIIGITTPLLTEYAAQSPVHLGTILYFIIGIVLLDKMKPSKLRNFALFIIFTLAYLGDPLTLYIFIIPVLIVLVLKWLYSGRPSNDLFLIGSFIAVIPFSTIVLELVSIFGGFHTSALSYFLPDITQIPNQIQLCVQNILYLFGVIPFGYKWLSIQGISSILRIIPLVLVFYFVIKYIVDIIKRKDFDLVSGILSVSIVFDIVAFILYAGSVDLWSSRYLLPVVILGAIVVGRNIKIKRRRYSIATILLFLSLSAFFIYRLFLPVAISPVANVENWLKSNNFTYGYGSYWNASIITVETNNSVKVRPIMARDDGYIVPYKWLSEDKWYEGEEGYFIVFDDKGYGGINLDTATKTFGPPSQINKIDSFTILTWEKDITFELHR